MKQIPQDVSESTKRRNPHLYCVTAIDPVTQDVSIVQIAQKRIRQSTKPLMNKLEQRLFDRLCLEDRKIYAQSITFKLANGVRYTPDLFCFDWEWRGESRTIAWEVKGDWFTDDAVVKLKVFAAAYPSILVLLAREDKPSGEWLFQEVFP